MFKFLNNLFTGAFTLVYLIVIILFGLGVLVVGGGFLYIVFDLEETWWKWLLFLLFIVVTSILDAEFRLRRKNKKKEKT